MKEMDISLLLKKAEELRALFVLGQRVIPFLEEIFLFVNDIKPLLDEINTSIKDNLKKMPNASKQLSKVTEATEMATTEIMDIVDGLFYKSDIIASNINVMSDINNSTKSNPIRIIELISQAMETEITSQDLVAQLTEEIQKFKNSRDIEFQDNVTKTNDILNSIKDDSNSIMMSLQVQDITSQQIAAVNHLLQTVQGKLSQIMDKFKNSEIGELVSSGTAEHSVGTNISTLHRDIAFDPDAVDAITLKETRQGDIDAMISSFDGSSVSNIPDPTDPASQDDIDSMFANMNGATPANIPDPTDPASQDDIDSMFASMNGTPQVNIPEPIDNSPASQDDINDMFAAVSNSVAAPAPVVEEDDFSDFSQDDIDALFGN